MVSQKYLRISIDDLVNLSGTNHQLTVLVIVFIVQIDFRTITIPQGVTHRGKLGFILAAVTLVSFQLPVNGIVP